MRSFCGAASLQLVVFLVVLPGCEQEDVPEITVQVGPRSSFAFAPRTALARYVEHPTQPDQLKLLIASYELGCNAFVAPLPGEVFVTVTAQVPRGEEIGVGDFPWGGDIEPLKTGQAKIALPFVRLADEGRALPAGGELRLEEVEKKLHGRIRGQLRFQDGGEGEAKTAGLAGSFVARICELSVDATRRQNQE